MGSGTPYAIDFCLAAPALAAGLGQVAPIASAAGVSFEDLAAAIATTTSRFLNTAESATAIKAVIAGIVAPSEAAGKALESISVSAASLREEGLDPAAPDGEVLWLAPGASAYLPLEREDLDRLILG